MPAVEVNMICELSRERAGGPFRSVLAMEEIRRWDDDPVPEVIETIVCEVELAASVSEIFLAVDEWLRASVRAPQFIRITGSINCPFRRRRGSQETPDLEPVW